MGGQKRVDGVNEWERRIATICGRHEWTHRPYDHTSVGVYEWAGGNVRVDVGAHERTKRTSE